MIPLVFRDCFTKFVGVPIGPVYILIHSTFFLLPRERPSSQIEASVNCSPVETRAGFDDRYLGLISERSMVRGPVSFDGLIASEKMEARQKARKSHAVSDDASLPGDLEQVCSAVMEETVSRNCFETLTGHLSVPDSTFTSFS
jgi:hypothetical protein